MSEPRPLTRPYTLSRIQLSLGFARTYLRNFWWVFAAIPLFGVIALTLTTDNTIRIIGVLCFLWPASIPARAYILTSRFARRFLKPTTLHMGDEDLFFAPEGEKGVKVGRNRIRSIRQEAGCEVLQTDKFGIILVPTEAFLTEADLIQFRSLNRF